MYLEERPTSVTVIGWAWIVIGALMAFSSVMALFISIIMARMLADQPAGGDELPFMLQIFPFLAAAQFIVAGVGIASGICFLKRKAWARKALEVLTWLVLSFLVAFMVAWMASWITMTGDAEVSGFSAMGVVMALGITALYGIPLAIMIRYLRGEKVRSAMQ